MVRSLPHPRPLRHATAGAGTEAMTARQKLNPAFTADSHIALFSQHLYFGTLNHNFPMPGETHVGFLLLFLFKIQKEYGRPNWSISGGLRAGCGNLCVGQCKV